MTDHFRRELHHILGEHEHSDPKNIVVCTHCGLRYDWRTSGNEELPMTFCSHICEMLENGVTVKDIMHAEEPEHDGRDTLHHVLHELDLPHKDSEF